MEQKLRKEIEEEMRKKYEPKETKQNEVIQYSEPVEVKTKARPIRMKELPPVRQPTATELLQQSYNEMKRLRQQEKIEKIHSFKTKMF